MRNLILILFAILAAAAIACSGDEDEATPTPVPIAAPREVAAAVEPEPTQPAESSLAKSPPSTDLKVGTKVGNRVPDFAMRLGDGTTVTSASLISAGKPVFLYFFATW